MGSSSGQTLVFVGTYTKSSSKGIYTFRMDNATGALTQISTIGDINDPSFLSIHPNGRYLYATAEIDDFGGETSGAVAAYAIDSASGVLTPLNQRPSRGTGPCHLTVDATGRWLVAANYDSGSVAVFPIEADGRLGEASHQVQHQGGSGVVPERQMGPHAHSVTIDPSNRFVLAADLGLDRVMIYELDGESGRLTPASAPWIESAPGAGPRHADFHPDGRYVCVINEIDMTLSSYAYEENSGGLTHIATESTLQGEVADDPSTADVHFSPDGRFVYGSNRGHHSLAIFAFDASSGKLDFVGHESTRGRTPRNFAIHPAGDIVLAANEGSDTIVEFRRDAESGKLTPTGQVVQVPMPVCIKFLPV